MTIEINNYLPYLPAWLLVLFRLMGIFVLAPVLGSVSVPPKIKVLWALALSFCIFPVLLARPASSVLITPLIGSDLSLYKLPAAIALELSLGMLIGYGASLALMGMQVAGHMADQQIGLGLASIVNPELDDQTGVIGEFYFIVAMMIFMSLGGERMMVSCLLDSFDRVPLGGFVPDGRVLDLLLGLLASMMELAVRIAAPLLCLVFLETVAMGFIARTVPQMNIMSVGFPLRIIMGISILIIALNSHVVVFTQTLRDNMLMVGRMLSHW